MRWTDGPERWLRVLTLLHRLEALVAALAVDAPLDDQAHERVKKQFERLHERIVDEAEREQRRLIDRANATGDDSPADACSYADTRQTPRR